VVGGRVLSASGQVRQLSPSLWPAGASLAPLDEDQHAQAHEPDQAYSAAVLAWEASGRSGAVPVRTGERYLDARGQVVSVRPVEAEAEAEAAATGRGGR
jgi:hypothetical protein